jgi:esterase/lipase superfamily enzyme/Tfp pilus assembly protein PilF
MDSQRREKLVRDLTNLYPPQLATVTTLVNFPSAYQPGAAASHAEHASALISWAESVGGCGLDALENFVKQVLPPAAESVPLRSRFINVPPHNGFFTGREEILSRLHKTLEPGGENQAAISGLGGIGKTATATEYAHRHREAYSRVLWTNAESESALTTGFAGFAPHLGLPFLEKADEQIAAVKGWLTDNPGWLLILDNADAPEIVKPFLPNPLTGAVLLTSRAANFDTLGNIDALTLDAMTATDALAFLKRRTKCLTLSESEEAAARELAESLGHLPLALEQAAAYVAKNRVPFAKYLEIYRTRQLELLKKSRPQTGDYRLTVETTWTLNFEQVETSSPAAADVLRVSAFCAPEPIPFELVEKGAAEISETLADALAQAAIVNEVLSPLTDYSLITMDGAREQFSVHRLVQAVTRERLGDTQREWISRAVKALNVAFPDPEFKNWGECERLTAHAQASAIWIKDYEMAFVDATRLLNKAGNYLYECRQYKKAEPVLKQALTTVEKTFGSEHLLTGMSLGDLARLYVAMGAYEKAEPLWERSLAINEKALGSEPPIIDQSLTRSRLAINLNDGVNMYFSQGKYAKALRLAKRALAIYEKGLGAEHPWTAVSLNGLVMLYSAQGEYGKALPLSERALAIDEKAYGAENPKVATSLSFLALLYFAQGEYGKALPLYERALAINEKALGAEHPATATSLHLLALLYDAQRDAPRAEELHARALAIREKELGAENLDTAGSLNNLAGSHEAQGEYRKALPLYERALTILEKALGTEHPNTKLVARNLAAVREKLAAAEPPSPPADALADAPRAIGESPENCDAVRLFFGTNRQCTSAGGDLRAEFTSDDAQTLSFGFCEVTVPRSHRMGELESPGLLRRLFLGADKSRHIILHGVEVVPEARFFAELARCVAASADKAAFVFVHGYNVTFADAARRTAQIAYDLRFDGAAAFFSWPSHGQATKYTHDENRIEQALTHLRDFLRKFLAESHAENVVLIAHSMGNRALTRAFLDLANADPTAAAHIREIILAAPDIDATVFRNELAPKFKAAGRPVTLYATANDTALRASGLVHGDSRVGDCRADVVVADGVETVDATAVNDSLLGHAVFAEERSVLNDMFYLVTKRLRARDRNLAPALVNGKPYWKFPD